MSDLRRLERHLGKEQVQAEKLGKQNETLAQCNENLQKQSSDLRGGRKHSK